MWWLLYIAGVLYLLAMGISYLLCIPAAWPHLRKYRVIFVEIEDESGYFVQVLTVFGWRYIRKSTPYLVIEPPMEFKTYEDAIAKIALLRVNKKTVLPGKYKFKDTIEVTAKEKNFPLL